MSADDDHWRTTAATMKALAAEAIRGKATAWDALWDICALLPQPTDADLPGADPSDPMPDPLRVPLTTYAAGLDMVAQQEGAGSTTAALLRAAARLVRDAAEGRAAWADEFARAVGMGPTEDERTTAERWAKEYTGAATWARLASDERAAREADMLPLVREARREQASAHAEIERLTKQGSALYGGLCEASATVERLTREREELLTEARESTNTIGELRGEQASRPAPLPPSTLDRDYLGRLVRGVWIAWAREQPNPKDSWLVPWEGLAESDKEVDRRIGERLAEEGRAAEASDCAHLVSEAWDSVSSGDDAGEVIGGLHAAIRARIEIAGPRPSATPAPLPDEIDAEDLWTDYRTEREHVGPADRVAFLAGVDAGRRTRPPLTDAQIDVLARAMPDVVDYERATPEQRRETVLDMLAIHGPRPAPLPEAAARTDNAAMVATLEVRISDPDEGRGVLNDALKWARKLMKGELEGVHEVQWCVGAARLTVTYLDVDDDADPPASRGEIPADVRARTSEPRDDARAGHPNGAVTSTSTALDPDALAAATTKKGGA